MADIDTSIISPLILQYDGFSTPRSPGQLSALDTFRASPRLVDGLNRLAAMSPQKGQIIMNTMGQGTYYVAPTSSADRPTIFVDPIDLQGNPKELARVIAHEVGHAVRQGGSIPGIMGIRTFDQYQNAAFGQEGVAILEEYIVGRELENSEMPPLGLRYDNGSRELLAKFRQLEQEFGGYNNQRFSEEAIRAARDFLKAGKSPAIIDGLPIKDYYNYPWIIAEYNRQGVGPKIDLDPKKFTPGTISIGEPDPKTGKRHFQGVAPQKGTKPNVPFNVWATLGGTLDGTIVIEGSIYTTDQNGTRTVTAENPSSGVVRETKTTWASGGTVVETEDAAGIITRVSTATIGGVAVKATFSLDADGNESLFAVNQVNGLSPTDVAAAKNALSSLHVSSMDLARMSDGSSALSGSDGAMLAFARGSVASILAAFDPSNTTGIANGEFDTVRGIASLLKAVQAGDSSAIALSSPDLIDLIGRGVDSSFSFSGGSTGSQGGDDIFASFLRSSQFQIFDYGDLDSALISGLGVAKGAVTIAQYILNGKIDALAEVYESLSKTIFGELIEPADLLSLGIGEGGLTELAGELLDLQSLSSSLSDIVPGINAVIGVIGAIDAFQQGDVLSGVLNSMQALVAVAMILQLIPTGIGQMIGLVIGAIQLISTMFGGSTYNPPIPMGQAYLAVTGDGTTVGAFTDANAYSRDGGGNMVTNILNPYAAAVNKLVETLRMGSFTDATLIPARFDIKLQKLQPTYSLTLHIKDEYGNAQSINYGSNNPTIRQGNELPIGDINYFRQGLGDTLLRAAMNAIGHKWEADTAYLQVQNSTGYGGRSALAYMAQNGLLESNPVAQNRTVKLITLDLPGAGSIPIATKAAGHGVMFDINANGYVNALDWVGPRAGILGIDRDSDGVLDTGRDLLSDMRFAESARGLGALEEFDTDGNHILTAVDPAFTHLRVWQDLNQDGIQQAHEASSLSELGITALNYTLGTFTQNGLTHLLSSTSLSADAKGVIVRSINGGVIVNHQDGTAEALATQVGDLTQLGQWQLASDGLLSAGFDVINTVENTSIVVSTAQLLTNDLSYDLIGGNLQIVSVRDDFNGVAILSADGKTIRFSPGENFAGAGQFSYRVQDETGRVADGIVQINVAHVNQAPTIANLPTYIWAATDGTHTYWYDDYLDPINTVTTIADPYSGRITVSDPDDTQFTYQIISGQASIDQNGNWWYDNRSFDGSYRVFDVRVTDGHGYSATQRVVADARMITGRPQDPPPPVDPPTYGRGSGGGDSGRGGSDGDGTPIAIDLDGNGITFKHDPVTLDFQTGNGPQQYAWIKSGDGFLAYDANGNGTVDNASEISFVRFKAGAKTDLEGLKGLDTNGDGTLDARDTIANGFQFNQLKVWSDLNEDGIVDTGEVQSMADAELKAIKLTGTGFGNNGAAVAGATFFGTTRIIKTDDSVILAADLALRVAATAQFNPVADLMGFGNTDILASGAVAAIQADGSVDIDLTAGTTSGDRKVITISADSSTLQYRLMKEFDGLGTHYLDRVATVITNFDGTRLARIVDTGNTASWQSVTRSYSATGVLISAVTLYDDLSRIVYTLTDDAGMVSYESTIDISGALVSKIGTRLDGSVYTDTYMDGVRTQRVEVAGGNASSVGWSTRTILYSTSGQITQQTIYVDQPSSQAVEVTGTSVDTLYTTIDYTLSDAQLVESLRANTATGLILTGNSFSNDIVGGIGNDSLRGGGGDDVLTGGLGDDTLTGGTGADNMAGGFGTDIYYVDAVGDVIVEAAGEGTDTVYTTIDFTLSTTPEIETLRAYTLIGLTLTGSGRNDKIYGNGGTDTLIGGAGDDLLYGGGGSDVMTGGAGDDTYYVDSASDQVIELTGGGTDTVYTNINLSLNDVPEVEVLRSNGAGLTLTGSSRNDKIYGGNGNDILIGNDGDDLLSGGVGSDVMTGGAGDDIYYVDSASDQAVEAAGGGTDTIYTSVNLSLNDVPEVEVLRANATGLTLTGSNRSDKIYGSSGADTLVGGAGDDWLDGAGSNDNMTGGAGDDTYVVNASGDVVLENPGEGIDTVLSSIAYTLGANVEKLTLTGSSAISGTGNALNNALTGNSGNNSLDGGIGTDIMTGGAGNDTYYVDDLGDQVVEVVGEGTDTVYAAVNYALNNTQEIEILRAAVSTGLTLGGSGRNDKIYGGVGADNLAGGAGDDLLDGGGGSDVMTGGAGDDTYYVDNSGDQAIEAAGEGTDTVYTSINLSLANTPEIEVLRANVSTGLTLTGSNRSDKIYGGSGADNLVGGAGDDWLDGGTGSDAMAGGAGSDVYVVNAASDVVTENFAEGIDTVQASATYTLGANLENLTLTGSAAISGTGNDLDNVLIGNSGANTLNGGVGADTMTGAAGDDTYYVDNAGDQVIEAAGGGVDTVYTNIDLNLADLPEIEILRGNMSTGQTLTGSSRNDMIYGGTGNDFLLGGAGDDFINGGAGNDNMSGGAGNDIYVVNVVTDVVTENANEGIDTVQSSKTYTLGANVENLTLTGTTAINGSGNGLANVLVGNSAANTLNGGAGADAMIGGAGDDTYYVDHVGDQVVEAANEGTDRAYVQTSLAYTIGDYVELIEGSTTFGVNVTGGNTGATIVGYGYADTLNGGNGNDILYGGAGDDTLAGAGGNDTLNGETGIDAMTGGGGDDTYYVDNVSDQVIEVAGQGTDRVYVMTSSAYTASDHAELIEGWTTGAVSITGGNTGATIVSYGYNDTLVGGSGNDVLGGGQGDDTLTGGAGNDLFYFARGDGQDRVNASMIDGSDTVAFSPGIAYDQLWFKRVSDDLEISVVGESQKVTVANWYASANNHAAQVVAGDGYAITDTGIAALVSAMAMFSPPASGQTILTDPNTVGLGTQLTANWQHT